MEILPKNSYILPEQCSFEIQEIEKILKKIDLSIRKDQNKNIIKKYISHFNLIESLVLMDQDKIFDGNIEMILLEQNQASDRRINNMSRHVIELSDNDSKMVLRRQFGEMEKHGNSNLKNSVDYENIEILRKLPPSTIVIRQKIKSDIEDSDYKEMTKTNGSSISSCTDGKMKGISGALRNKT